MVLNYEAEIEMLLFDEEKIVSYKEVSNRFDITPQEAQRVLDGFLNGQRKQNKTKSEIFATYMLITKQEKRTKIQLINEDDLDKIQEPVVSKQIYSLQNKRIDDFNLIYSSDLDASSNIYRKSNLNVVSKEPSGTVILGESSNTLKSNVATKTTTTTVKPPAPEKPVPAVTKPQLSEKLCASQEKPSAQKENAKVKTEPTVKQEPKQDHDETEKKKPKPSSEPETKKSAPPAKKADPKKSAQQASITSFFKKT